MIYATSSINHNFNLNKNKNKNKRWSYGVSYIREL
jgi:hypothetical protein